MSQNNYDPISYLKPIPAGLHDTRHGFNVPDYTASYSRILACDPDHALAMIDSIVNDALAAQEVEYDVELREQLDNALITITRLEEAIKRARVALKNNEPLDLAFALATDLPSEDL